MGKPDGAHTHGHGGGGLGLNGIADPINRFVLLPIAAACLILSFLHFILLALFCVGALAVGFVAGRLLLWRAVRRAVERGQLGYVPRPAVLPQCCCAIAGARCPVHRELPGPVTDARALVRVLRRGQR